MNVYDPYPDRVVVGGKTYKIDFDFATVLRVLDVQASDELTFADKQEVMARLMIKRCPQDPGKRSEIMKAILDLFPKSDRSGQRYIDFHQDAKLIRSAFLRMGHDLTRERMHFFKFLELLADVPEDTALARVIDIRQRPTPEPNKHNGKQIQALMEAKAKVAIKLPDDERMERFAQSLKQSTVLRG